MEYVVSKKSFFVQLYFSMSHSLSYDLTFSHLSTLF